MFHIVLYEPEIPPNTGNIIRLCANTGCQLHLIKPLGFIFDDKRLRRAGLDYHEWANVAIHESLAAFTEQIPSRLIACSSRAETSYHRFTFTANDALLFGPETRGLPLSVMAKIPQQRRLRIPMHAASRSLNLSNAAAIITYEAWRQLQFAGGEESPRLSVTDLAQK